MQNIRYFRWRMSSRCQSRCSANLDHILVLENVLQGTDLRGRFDLVEKAIRNPTKLTCDFLENI